MLADHTRQYIRVFALALLFPALTVVLDWCVVALQCQGYFQSQAVCELGGMKLLPLFRFALFWCSLLAIPVMLMACSRALRIYRDQQQPAATE